MKKQRQLNRSRYRWLAMLVAILSLTGCTISFPPPGTPGAAPGGTTPGDMTPSSTPNSESAPLAGTSWQLTALGTTGAETPVVVDSTVTLQFDADGQAGGNTGCNSFGGNYTVNGDSLTFSKIISTLVACADADVMNQEQQYLDALNGAERYAVDGDELTIWYDNGNSMLTFTAGAAPTPVPTTEGPTATPAIPATPLPTVTPEPTTDGNADPGDFPPGEATRINFGPGKKPAPQSTVALRSRDRNFLCALCPRRTRLCPLRSRRPMAMSC
ncbi:MAG: META domain-containing protein [Caldilineaceae bacterium]